MPKKHPCRREFLAPGAPCEINIDGRTMERVQNEMKRPSRFTFDKAAEHVYNLLLKKDCYPRFVRSEHYKQLLANALQPSHKKRYLSALPFRSLRVSIKIERAPSLIHP